MNCGSSMTIGCTMLPFSRIRYEPRHLLGEHFESSFAGDNFLCLVFGFGLAGFGFAFIVVCLE